MTLRGPPDDLEIMTNFFAIPSLPHVPSLVPLGHSHPFDLEMTPDDLEIITKIFATQSLPHVPSLVLIGHSVKI